MSRQISISRAARLVGVKRGALQKMVQSGKLQTFEGQLRLTDILQLFPDARLEDSSMLERVEQIIENTTFTRDADDRRIPGKEILARRVMEISQELIAQRRRNKHYSEFIHALQEKIHTLCDTQQSANNDPGTTATLLQWCTQQIESLHSHNDSNSISHANAIFLRTMTAQVTVVPSGHDFFVDGADSLLDAGLRGGLALDYGCSNGNCGRCKVRTISGQTRQIRHHDYTLTETEKNLGYILGCAHTALTDLVIEADEASGTHDIPTQSIAIKCKKVDTDDNTVTIVSLKTPRTQRLRFLAGQSATLTVAGIGSHSYPIASCPCDDMNLQFHIPVDSNNLLATHFRNTAKLNDSVQLDGPTGDFTLNENSPNALVFIAQDAGFAPVKALIEHAMALDTAEHITLIRIGSHSERPYLHNLCRAWNDALDNFHYHPVDCDMSDTDALQDHLGNFLREQNNAKVLDYYCSTDARTVAVLQAAFAQHEVPQSAQKFLTKTV